MSAAIDFYFDFSSPYGYLAAEKIEALAAKYQRSVVWHPILLGVVFKSTNSMPLTSRPPVMANYYKRDFERSARFHGLAYRQPSEFPVGSVAPSRLAYWCLQAAPDRAPKLILDLYRAFFTNDRKIDDPEVSLQVAAEVGLDVEAARVGMQSDAVRARLRAEIEAAIAKGVFGSPWIDVDGEPFWGADRLDHVEAWLARGGF